MSENRLRIATWNIHMAIGGDGQRDMTRTMQVLSQLNAGVIGLQEVDNRIENDRNDLLTLREHTRFEVIPGPTMKRPQGDYGNLLLTRLPVLKVDRFDISYKAREPRGLLLAKLDYHGRPLHVAVTHLGLRPNERRDQVTQICRHLETVDSEPLILLGDFNEWLLWGRPLRWLQLRFGKIKSPPTFPSRWPLLQLDHILVKPQSCLLNKTVLRTTQAQAASDHLPLIAELRV